MVAYGKAIDEWYVQAGRVEQHLVKVQDAKKITLKDESGHTDDISGATITINDFVALVVKALAAGAKKY
jgi:Na+-translocating ferredoxin:NAD+ oxidoreductase RnfG subunit